MDPVTSDGLPGGSSGDQSEVTGVRPKRGKSGPAQSCLSSARSSAISSKKQKLANESDHFFPLFWPSTATSPPDHQHSPAAAGPSPGHCSVLSAYENGCGDSPDSCVSVDDFAPDDLPSPDGSFSTSRKEEGDEKSAGCDTLPDPLLTDFAKPADLAQWLSMFQLWTNTERMSALESLVTNGTCDGQQIRFLLSLIEPQLQRDFVSLLPKELALYVLSFLDPKDLLQAAQTCRYWRILCEDNLLWREKCREEGLLEDQETVVDLFRKRVAKNRSKSLPQSHSASASGTSSTADAATPVLSSEYKLGYLRQKAIEFNWRYGRFPADPESGGPVPSTIGRKGRYLRPIQQLKGHDDHVITCLQFNPTSNLIVSGSDDNTLKVWSSTTGKCLQTLTGHTGGVWSSQLSPADIVISGSTDRTLKVWNAFSGECLHTLYGHTSTVRCMALHNNFVVSGSRDATLRVWDITTGECAHVLQGHLAAVRCVQFNGDIVVSGAYDFLVKVWDVHTESLLHTLEGHTNRVYSLQFDGINIVSGSLDTSIRVWNASSGALRHTLVGHQSLTSGMQLRGNILVSGNADSTVKVWNIETGQCLQTLAGANKHQSAVTCLQFNSRFVITSSDDGTVKLWDLKTGDFIRNLVSLPSGGSGGVVWRIRASNTRLICAAGSRNGTEETKLLVLDFDNESETERPARTFFPPRMPCRFDVEDSATIDLLDDDAVSQPLPELQPSQPDLEDLVI